MSRRPNPKNERIKRRFLEYRKYAKRLSEKTLDKELAALERFDVWNGRKDFARFHIEWAMGFARAGLPAFGPHAFRHMLARHVAKTSTSVAELVATSQNLGHTDVLTTLRSYGQISRERQRELITGEKAEEED